MNPAAELAASPSFSVVTNAPGQALAKFSPQVICWLSQPWSVGTAAG